MYLSREVFLKAQIRLFVTTGTFRFPHIFSCDCRLIENNHWFVIHTVKCAARSVKNLFLVFLCKGSLFKYTC